MPVIWAAISGHGYGHAAQVVPVLNALGRLVPELSVLLRTTVPIEFFRDRLMVPWTRQSVLQDVGCIQRGPLEIDVRGTWEALRAFHRSWDERLAQEVRDMQAVAPRLILADTPYLACAAGAAAGIPTIGLANFTWNEVLAQLTEGEAPDFQTFLAHMHEQYRQGTRALRITPGLPLSSYKNVVDIGPIAEPAPSQRHEVRQALALEDHANLVLVGFGGIALESLPWDCMERMRHYRFLVDGTLPRTMSNVHSTSSLPFTFKTLLASVDAVMTKPGYGTTVEAVALGTPVVYVRRFNFADEAPLVDFLETHGKAVELSRADFSSGHWEPALTALEEKRPRKPAPTCSGAQDAARLLAPYF